MLAALLGRLKEAIGRYRTAIELQPGYAAAHDHLGILLSRTGQLEQAITHFQTALQLQPRQAATCNNLGVA